MTYGKIVNETVFGSSIPAEFVSPIWNNCRKAVVESKMHLHMGREIDVKIHFIDTPINAPFIIKLGPNKYSLSIPAGFTIRFWAISTFLLQHYNTDHIGRDIREVFSPIDDMRDMVTVYMPDRWSPIFNTFDNIGKHVNSFEKAIKLAGPSAHNTSDTAYMSAIIHYVMVFHELAHAHYRHMDLYDGSLYVAERSEFSDDEFWEGAEIHADLVGVVTAFKYCIYLAGGVHGEDFLLLCHRFAYAISALCMSFEGKYRFLGEFDNTNYRAAVVRYEMYKTAISGYLRQIGEREYEAWKKIELDTYIGVIRDAWALSFETKSKDPDVLERTQVGDWIPPFQILNYGTVATSDVDRRLKEVKEIYQKFYALLERAGCNS